MVLSEAETQALVTAMRNWMVEVSMPGSLGDTTLDIVELIKYDGQGRCNVLIIVGDDMCHRHGDSLRSWVAQAKHFEKVSYHRRIGHYLCGFFLQPIRSLNLGSKPIRASPRTVYVQFVGVIHLFKMCEADIDK